MNKTKIIQVIKEYLKQFKYPNCQPEIVLQELPNIWKLLNKEGLVKESDSYQKFFNNAHEMYQIHKIQNNFWQVYGRS